MSITRKFSGCHVETYIFTDDDGCNILKTKIGNREYGFNVNWVPEDQMQWFAEVYSESMRELQSNTIDDTLKDVKQKYKEFVNFFGGDRHLY